MRERWRITLLLAIMIAVLVVVGTIFLTMLYRAALGEQKERLSEIARGMAVHFREIARSEGILDDVRDGAVDDDWLRKFIGIHTHFITRTKTGEIVVARREGETMVFLSRKESNEDPAPQTLPFDSPLAQPMKRALSGLSGTMVGSDYGGETVLAAYEPVPELGLGVVAKIDLAEIRAPFVRAGTTASVVALLLALLGSFAFLRISAPMIRHIAESEARLRLAYDAAKAGAWEWDLKTNENTWSDDVWRLYGLEPRSSEPSYELWKKSIHPEDRSAAEAAVKNAAERGGELNAEWRVNNPDAPERWLMSRGRPQREASGRVVRYRGIVIDITERKQAEQALQASETRYRRLFESAKDGILILDAHTGSIVDANPYLLSLLGYSAEEILGKELWEIGLFKDIAANRDGFRQLQEKAYIRYEDLPLETRDGRPISVEFVSNVYLVDHKKVVQCNIRDITERKRGDEELRLIQSRLQAVLDFSPTLISIKDLKGNVILANRRFEVLDAPPLHELIGQNIFDLFPKDVAQALWDNDVAAAKSGAPVQALETVHHKDGTWRDYLTVKFPVKGLDDKVFGTCAISTDITERKRAEEKLLIQNRISNIFLTVPDQEMYNDVLNVIMEVMESKYGVFGYID